jgi:hypothetical protein
MVMAADKLTPVSEVDVRTLANAAGLSLEQGRETAVYRVLSPWLEAARELNGKMAQRRNSVIMPITVVKQPRY